MSSSSFLKSYDLALKSLIYNRFGGTLGIDTQSSTEEENVNKGVFQFPKEVALRIAAEKRGENFLEFINYYRVGAGFSWSRQRTPLARRGMWLSTVEDEKVNSTHVKAVPIDLNYNIWFWSQDLDKVYEIIEDYVFWQQDSPKISLQYDDLFDITPDIHFGEIVDESTVDEQFQKGLMYCFKMPIKIDAWALRDFSFKLIHKITVTFYDKNDVTNYEEIIVEDSDQDTELEAALRFFRKVIYNIYEIDLTTNSIVISGSFADDFVVGEKIQIMNSTGNDDIYTVVSSSFADKKTSVVVSETLCSSVADGTIYKVE